MIVVYQYGLLTIQSYCYNSIHTKRIRNAMTSITQKIIRTLQSPETKRQNLEPIRKEAKKSLLVKLKENQELVKRDTVVKRYRSKEQER